MYRCTIVQIQKQLFKQENLPHPTFGPTQAFQSIKATLSKNKGDFNAHIPGFQAPISCFSEESLLDKGFWTTKQGLQVTLSGAPSTSQWWSHTRRPLDHRPGVSSIQMLQGVHLRPPPPEKRPRAFKHLPALDATSSRVFHPTCCSQAVHAMLLMFTKPYNPT